MCERSINKLPPRHFSSHIHLYISQTIHCSLHVSVTMPSSITSTTTNGSAHRPHASNTNIHKDMATDDPSDYFDAAADAFLAHHLVYALRLVARVVYHAATVALGLRVAKWYFDRTRPLAEERFVYLVLTAVGAVPFVLAVPLYGLVTSYAVRRGLRSLSRSMRVEQPSRPSRPPSESGSGLDEHTDYDHNPVRAEQPRPRPSPQAKRDLTVPLLAAIAILTLLLLWQSTSPSPAPASTPNPFLSPFPAYSLHTPLSPPTTQFDPTALRYELHADVHHTVQVHLADLRRELVAQSQCHAKELRELQTKITKLQGDLETLQNQSIAHSLQNAVDACGVAKVAELAAAAYTWLKIL